MIEVNYIKVLIAFALVLVAFILAKVKSVPVEKDIAFGSIRSFFQLVAVGYALEFIFNVESFWLIILSVVVMLVIGSYTAGERAKSFKGGFLISFISMSIGSLITLGLMLLLKIISAEARYIIPLSGMIISNSMYSSAIILDRVGSDLKDNRLEIETALSLGKSWQESSKRFYRNSVRAGMISILSFMKTAGIVALPGAMTGMILAGVSPLKAVLIQVIVAYMLVSSVAITSVLTAELTIRRFFNEADQFVG